jgi:hypothetical protein
MPPTNELKERVLTCFAEMQSASFTANRTAIRAGDPNGVQLSWSVKFPAGCPVSLALNNISVPKTATRQVNPVGNISYRLVARGAGLSRTIGVINITVDTSACTEHEIEEADLVPVIQAGVRASLNEYNADPSTDNKVTERKPAQVDIEERGVVVKLRLKLAINNFFDPDVNIDAVLQAGIAPDGKALVFYKSFSVDVDWPWWVTGITLGITKIVEEFLDGAVEKKIKPRMLSSFKAQVDGIIRISGTVSRIATAQDRVIVTTCS